MGKLKVKLKLSKEESLTLFVSILESIKKQKRGFFQLKKLRGSVHGYCDWDEIVIDYKKEFIPTVIHEVIHLLNPEWCETNVIYAEKQVLKYISSDDIICLLKILVKKL